MMYRYLIYVVVALLIGGAGYYFHVAGVPELIASGGDRRGNGVSAIDVFSGVYECTDTTGCKNTVRLSLQQDTTVDITETVDGQEVSLGQGTWGIGGGGALVLIVHSADPDAPTSLVAKKISGIKISGFSSKKGVLYEGMKDPVFTRVQSEADNSTVAN